LLCNIRINLNTPYTYKNKWRINSVGIPCSMASRNMPGFDLTAHNIDKKKSVKIQVKYSRAKNNDGVKIHNFGFDLLICST